jgi:3-hydroxybutyryl-CoA dehydrogenase
MIIAVLADQQLEEEFLAKGHLPEVEIIRADSVRSLGIIEADAYFDLLFENEPERVSRLKNLLSAPVFVNAVSDTTAQIGAPFIRINAWPTMLGRQITEYSTETPHDAEKADAVFRKMGWVGEWVPDTVGMITPRIVSMIINEAWYAFEEKISTKEEIDRAMRLGTNYPYGPFEWGDKIGMERIVRLLEALERSDKRYTIAPPLKTYKKTTQFD